MDTQGTIWLPNTQMATTPPPLEVVATRRQTLTLADGRQIIDALASWWTACHGYNEPSIINAIKNQADALPHVMLGGIVHPQAQRLAARLTAILPGDLNHLFYSESGSVAIEIALKMALQFWMNQNQPQRNRFIYFQDGYHGDTLYTMSVCDPIVGMHRLFAQSLMPQYFHALPQTQAQLATFEKWLQAHAHETAGLIIEPLVQGAGGMKIHSPEILHALYQCAKKYDILFIADEIFTGFGRSGSFFACEEAQITPDILCLSKAITGGTLPLAVTVAKTFIYDAFLSEDPEKALMHGSTFMGNPLACAAANASLDLFESKAWQTQVPVIEALLTAELSALNTLSGVKAVRVKGAIGAIELVRPLGQDLNWFKAASVKEGIWCRPLPSGDVIYTTPAFTIEKEELMTICQVFKKLITHWSKQYFA